MRERRNSIDVLRGLAIIFMSQFHIYYHWIFCIKRYDLFEDIIFFFGSISTPIFIFVSGISFFLFINKKININLEKKKIIFEIMKRALFIFIITTSFQIFFGYLLDMQITFIIYWSLFQVIAFSMIIFCFLPFLKRKIRMFFYLFLFIFIYILNFLIIFHKIVPLYFLTDGIHGFIPYANFFIFGLFLGDLLTNSSPDGFKKNILVSLPISIVFVIIGFLGFLMTGDFMENKITYYIMSFGVFLILFSACYYFFDFKKVNHFLPRMIIRWGKFSFSIYYIHFGFIAMGKIIFPLLINDLYSKGFLYYQFLIIILFFFVSLELFMKIWEKIDYKFGLEWLMNKISKKSLFFEKMNEYN